MISLAYMLGCMVARPGRGLGLGLRVRRSGSTVDVRRSPKPELLQLLARSLAVLPTQQPAANRSKAVNGQTNGHANGLTNGYTERQTNGRADRQTNGQSSGHTNGHSNGYANGLGDGSVKASIKDHKRQADAAGNSVKEQVRHEFPFEKHESTSGGSDPSLDRGTGSRSSHRMRPVVLRMPLCAKGPLSL